MPKKKQQKLQKLLKPKLKLKESKHLTKQIEYEQQQRRWMPHDDAAIYVHCHVMTYNTKITNNAWVVNNEWRIKQLYKWTNQPTNEPITIK